MSPAGRNLLSILRAAGNDGLDPSAYFKTIRLPASASESRPAAWAAAEIALSFALARYLDDLMRAPAGFFYVDGEVPRRKLQALSALRAIERGVPIEDIVTDLAPPNPLYRGLKEALADHRARRRAGAVQDSGWNELERTILQNMDRTRALPAMAAGRYLLVDINAARLLMIENATVRDEMRVIVGKPGEQTPDMAGQIRFVVLNPYWNLPPDLVARRARQVLADGPTILSSERLELLSDWSADPRRLRTDEVDWQAVAEGRQKLRVRQLPGDHNMMGKIKFMMPNRLGIYLHDTPFKEAFGRKDRRLSSGCVRVEDARRLSRWLFRGTPPRARSTSELRVDLPQPVPVYMLYLTAIPGPRGIATRPDAYDRDPRSFIMPRLSTGIDLGCCMFANQRPGEKYRS